MKLTIHVIRNHDNRNTLLHPLIVQSNDGVPQSRRCSTFELLGHLKKAGVSDDGFNRVLGEIEDKGWTVLESAKIIDADLARVLEPVEDLGKVLLCEARQQLGA